MVTSSVALQRPGAIALSFEQVQWARLSTIATNLSNSGTPGFKAMTLRGEEAPYTLPSGEVVSYVKVGQLVRDMQAGSFKRTENPLDVAILGRGYFKISTPEGIRFTRNGQLRLRSDGTLLGPSDDPILNEGGGEIVLGPEVTDVKINDRGQLIGSDGVSIARLGVFRVMDEQNIGEIGNSLMITEEEGEPVEDVKVSPGTIEESNVNAAAMTMRLIEVTRLYEQAVSVAKTADETERSIMNISAA